MFFLTTEKTNNDASEIPQVIEHARSHITKTTQPYRTVLTAPPGVAHTYARKTCKETRCQAENTKNRKANTSNAQVKTHGDTERKRNKGRERERKEETERQTEKERERERERKRKRKRQRQREREN